MEANGSFEKWKESSHSLWDQPKGNVGNVLDLAFIQLYPEECYETLLLYLRRAKGTGFSCVRKTGLGHPFSFKDQVINI